MATRSMVYKGTVYKGNVCPSTGDFEKNKGLSTGRFWDKGNSIVKCQLCRFFFENLLIKVYILIRAKGNEDSDSTREIILGEIQISLVNHTACIVLSTEISEIRNEDCLIFLEKWSDLRNTLSTTYKGMTYKGMKLPSTEHFRENKGKWVLKYDGTWETMQWGKPWKFPLSK